MILELGTFGKYQVLSNPSALPNKCVGCGLGYSPDDRVRFIDTGQSLDFYGVIYFCTNCFTEIAESLGLIHADKWQAIVESSTDTLIENDRIKAENDGLLSALHILTGHRCHSDKSANSISEEAENVEPEPSSGIAEGIKSEERSTNEPDSESGLSDIRGTSEPKSKSTSSKSKSIPDSHFEL